jgi:hypothetical protein
MSRDIMRVVNTAQATTEFTVDELGFRWVFLVSQDVLTVQFRGADGVLHACVLGEGYDDKDLDSVKLVASAICHALNAGVNRDKLFGAAVKLFSFALGKSLEIPTFRPAGLCYELTARYIWPSCDGTTVMVIHPDVSVELLMADDE